MKTILPLAYWGSHSRIIFYLVLLPQCLRNNFIRTAIDLRENNLAFEACEPTCYHESSC